MNAPHQRTIVYVDGFNFYYGAVRGTPWEWLDLPALFRLVLPAQTQLEKVKYFTARVQPTANDPRANVRQDAYLRALQAHCHIVELYYGHFPSIRSSTKDSAYHHHAQPRRKDQVTAAW